MNASTLPNPRIRAALALLLLAVLAVVAFVAVGALSDDDDSPVTARDRTEVPAAEVDEPVDPAAGACLAGSTDCADIPG